MRDVIQESQTLAAIVGLFLTVLWRIRGIFDTRRVWEFQTDGSALADKLQQCVTLFTTDILIVKLVRVLNSETRSLRVQASVAPRGFQLRVFYGSESTLTAAITLCVYAGIVGALLIGIDWARHILGSEEVFLSWFNIVYQSGLCIITVVTLMYSLKAHVVWKTIFGG
jgi:hypothetical protein